MISNTMEAYRLREYGDRRTLENYGEKDIYGNLQTVQSTPLKRRHYIDETEENDDDYDLLSDCGYFSISPSSPHNLSFRRNSEKLENSFCEPLRSPFKSDDVISTPRRLTVERDCQRNRKYQNFACESTPKKKIPFSPRRCHTERKYSATEYLPYQPRSHSCLKSRRRHLDSNPECNPEQTYQRLIPRRNLNKELNAVKTADTYIERQENCSFYSNSIGPRIHPCCTSLPEPNRSIDSCDYARRRPSFRHDDDTTNHYCANTSESRTSYPVFEKHIHTRCPSNTTEDRRRQNTYAWYTPSEGQRIIDSIRDCEENEESNHSYTPEDRSYLLNLDQLRTREDGCREPKSYQSIAYRSDADEESGYPCYVQSTNNSTRSNRVQSGTSRHSTIGQGVCSCVNLKQGLLRLASGAYSNIRRKASSPEDFKQFKTELDLTNAFLQQTLDMIKRIKDVCGNCD